MTYRIRNWLQNGGLPFPECMKAWYRSVCELIHFAPRVNWRLTGLEKPSEYLFDDEFTVNSRHDGPGHVNNGAAESEVDKESSDG